MSTNKLKQNKLQEVVELVPKGMRSHYLTPLNLNYILHINYILLQA